MDSSWMVNAFAGHTFPLLRHEPFRLSSDLSHQNPFHYIRYTIKQNMVQQISTAGMLCKWFAISHSVHTSSRVKKSLFLRELRIASKGGGIGRWDVKFVNDRHLKQIHSGCYYHHRVRLDLHPVRCVPLKSISFWDKA